MQARLQRKRAASGRGGEKHETNLEQEMDEAFMSERAIKTKPEKQRKRQEAEEYVGATLSGRILKEAQKQQKEIDRERDEETGVAAARRAFSAATESATWQHGRAQDSDSEEEEEEREGGGGYSDTESQYEDMVIEEITEADERAMRHFLAAESAPTRTLADIIMAKIREKEMEAGIAPSHPGDETSIPGIDPKIAEVYKSVGKLLSRYRAGKVPKAFKIVPSLSNWEEILFLTEPESWTPSAVFAATRLFASNLNAKMAQRFYHLVLLPRVRADIGSNRRLHFALYQALKKAVYKPAAFYKGVLLPLCQSRSCSLREAFIIGSVLQKVSIPVLHSSVAVMKIAEMEYAGTNSYFLKLLLDKKYALPYRVIDSLMTHFLSFEEEERELPVVWHQSLLTFVQRYKDEISEEDKDALKRLMKRQKHYLMTAEIHRELQHAQPRGGGASGKNNPQSASFLVKKAVDEDYKTLPEATIGMDEEY